MPDATAKQKCDTLSKRIVSLVGGKKRFIYSMCEKRGDGRERERKGSLTWSNERIFKKYLLSS